MARCRAAVVPAHGQLDRRRPRRQSVRHRRHAARTRCAAERARVLGFYLDELHALGAELSLDGAPGHRLRRAAGAGRALARPLAAPRRTSPTGARCPASTRASRRPPHALGIGDATRRAGRRCAAPIRSADGVRRPTSTSLHRSLARQRLAALIAPRPAAHAAPRRRRLRLPSRRRSTCARTPTCTSASSPSCSRRRAPRHDYTALAEDGARRAAAGRARRRRACCARPSSTTRDETRGELAIFARPPRAHAALRRGRDAATTSSRKADGVSDLLEVALLLKEAGLLRPREGAHATSTSCRCSRPSTTCATAAASWTRCFALPDYARAARQPRRRCRR